jgi:choice-of-anchor B domain-containing protein
MIFDVTDLDDIQLINRFEHDTVVIDHNLYTLDGLAYMSNYEAGLRIQDLDDVANGVLTEVAWFDTYPESDNAAFNGTWSNFPFFKSGTVAVSGIGEGLFLLRVQDDVLATYAD